MTQPSDELIDRLALVMVNTFSNATTPLERARDEVFAVLDALQPSDKIGNGLYVTKLPQRPQKKGE